MDFAVVLIICALTFGLCWLIDKGFTKLFRSQAQHASGKAVRLNKRYATGGIILIILAVLAMFNNGGSMLLLIGGLLILVVGAGLIIYYVSTGIFYDEDTFLYTSFGKKNQVYRYRDIQFQQLYVIQGGSVLVELHMTDGSAVQVSSQMTDHEKFLSHASVRWCRQRGLDPEHCNFLDPDNHCWFPSQEDT